MDAINSVLQAKQTSLDSQVQMAVARKALDIAKVQGDALNQMLAVAARIGKGVGTGENFDAIA